MAIIKSHTMDTLLRDAIVLDLGDLTRQGAALKAAAEAQARQIIQKAEADAAVAGKRIREDARVAGHADGLQRGLKEGRDAGRKEAIETGSRQLEQLQQAWIEAASQWDAQCQTNLRESRELVLRFALQLAEKVVHRAIEIDPSVIVDQVEAALGHVLGPHAVKVRIHPADRPTLEAAMPQLLAAFGQLQNVELIDDPEVSPGGCVIRYDQGMIDATVETQMRRIVDALLGPAGGGVEQDLTVQG